MLLILFVLFIVVPTIEISLFIEVGDEIGVWPTIGLTFLTAAIGAILVRTQGLQTLITAQERMQQGEMPTQQLVEGFLLVLAGIFLFTPGFMTDSFGVLLLIPMIRHWVATGLMKRMAQNVAYRSQYHAQNAGSDSSGAPAGKVFEGEFERKSDPPDRLN